jgi:hypothetical protein
MAYTSTKLHPAENIAVQNFLNTGSYGAPLGDIAAMGHKYERYGWDEHMPSWAAAGAFGAVPEAFGLGAALEGIGRHYGWWGKEQRPFTDMPASIPIGGGAELDVQKIWKDPKNYGYAIMPDYTYGDPGAPGGPMLTALSNYVEPGNQLTIGGRQVDLTGPEAQASKIRKLLSGLQYDRPWRNEEREYLSTAGALREAIGAAYGINTGGRIGTLAPEAARERKEELGLTGDYEALDPLVRLQQQLQQEYQNYQIQDNQNLINQMFQNRNQSLNNLLSAQSAALGTPGLYQGVMGASEASRDTLASQARAAYKPMEAAMEQQYQAQNQQLLAALQQLQAQTEATVRSMGKQGVFERG